MLFAIVLFVQSSIAQDLTQSNLPDAAKARLGKGTIFDIAYSPDGTRLAVAGGIGIWLYDAATGTETSLLTGHTRFVTSVAYSPDGSTLASGSGDRTIWLWDVHTGKHLKTLEGHTDGGVSVVFSPDGKMLASGGGWKDEAIRLWDANSGLHLRTFDGNFTSLTQVATYSSDIGYMSKF